jgi:hypothetical protein
MLDSMSRYDRHVPGKNGNDQLIAAAERRLQELEQEREATLAKIASPDRNRIQRCARAPVQDTCTRCGYRRRPQRRHGQGVRY